MIKSLKKTVWKILNKLRIGAPIQLMLTGGLLDDGWFNSFNTKQAIDKDKKPIPWCSYPFIKFIEPRLKKDFSVFEFGSGNSTLWYAERVGKILSVENDKGWFDLVSKKVPENAKIIFQMLEYNGEYCKKALAANNKFDVIIIDGRDRVNCIKHSIGALKEQGVLIFDNSNLPQYSDGISYLISNGFRKLDFIGLSPVTPHNNCTSIFYRPNNCLGI